jgi:hypothetical protein
MTETTQTNETALTFDGAQFIVKLEPLLAYQLQALAEAKQLTEGEAIAGMIHEEHLKEYKTSMQELAKAKTKAKKLDTYLSYTKDAYTRTAAAYFLADKEEKAEALSQVNGEGERDIIKLARYLYGAAKLKLKDEGSKLNKALATIALERVDFTRIAEIMIQIKNDEEGKA